MDALQDLLVPSLNHRETETANFERNIRQQERLHARAEIGRLQAEVHAWIIENFARLTPEMMRTLYERVGLREKR